MELVKAKKFDWINPAIREGLFETPKEVATEFDLMTIDKRMSSEDIIKQMADEGYRPANAWELLDYNWNGKDIVVALGSVCKVRGYRFVLYLYEDRSKRGLCLSWWGGGWGSRYRFLRVRNSVTKTLETKALGNLGTLALAIETVKKAGYVVYKQI